MTTVLAQREKSTHIPQYQLFEQQFQDAAELVDDVVLKKYITKMETMNIVPLNAAEIDKNITKNVRMFKINEIVYAQDEDATFKLASVLNAAAVTDSSVFILMDSNGVKVDFYMGIRSLNETNSTKTSYDTLKNAMYGHFPGIKTKNLLKEDIESLLANNQSSSVSIVTGVANYKDVELKNNLSFIQGLEKLALSMQGEKFTGIILANPVKDEELSNVRREYENIYSLLAPFATTQFSYGVTDSINDTKTYSTGMSTGKTDTVNISRTETTGSTVTDTTSKSTSENTAGSKGGKIAAGGLAAAGALIGTSLGPVGTMAGLAIGGAIGGAVAGATHKTESLTEGSSIGKTNSIANTSGSSEATTETNTQTKSDARGFTKGNTETIQLTTQNKKIQGYLQRIDQQLNRLREGESLGMWECAAYFMSDTPYAADIAAASYKSLMQGEQTGIESSSISSWSGKNADTKEINKYIQNFIHPVFSYTNSNIQLPIMPTALVTSKELAIQMSLPRKSVSGFPVIEHAEFGREVVRHTIKNGPAISIGAIFSMGKILESPVKLDVQSLSMHTFITGSTGSGKSNTIYEILNQLEIQGIKFLVIEPAKGEYKHIFGTDKNVTVLGTNPKKNELLKINPFKFPDDIHVLEHIDRLVEIFNVCWPMYAAMPAILKEAILHCYSECNWDLDNSCNIYGEKDTYPTFKDLLTSLEIVINQTAYDSDTKGNYIGSLVTRVKSLTNGLNGQIFCGNELDNEILFDSNVIVDLSRVGSAETKSLIMGILIMRLNEYRMAHAKGLNSPLKHVTVLEEAHNLLKRTSSEQSIEGANLAGKSVEMLANAIAEMRTYGEGFIIADQSPGMLDMSAIRNTNTKIIMRLPEEADRRLVGKAAAVKDSQLDELAKLPKGVAAIYQNDWLEPVLCQVYHFQIEPKIYQHESKLIPLSVKQKDITVLCKFLLQGRVRKSERIDPAEVSEVLERALVPAKTRLQVSHYLQEENGIKLFDKKNFGEISRMVTDLLEIKPILSQWMARTTNLLELNNRLADYISSRTEDLESEMILAISQCLLRECSSDSNRSMEFFKQWTDAAREGKLQ